LQPCKIFANRRLDGGAENARLENAGLELSAPNYKGWKMQDWKYLHYITGGGKCGTGIIGTILHNNVNV